MIVNDPGNKRLPAGRDVYYVGVPDIFAPGYLGWDRDAPTKRPRVYLDVIFQEDASRDRRTSMIGELEFVNKGDADGLDIVDSKVDDGESALEMIYEEDTGETPELEMELSINSGSKSNGELKPKNHKWWGHRKLIDIGTGTPITQRS